MARQGANASEDSSIPALERAAFAAWPAARVLDVDGWKLRLTGGMTRRANSVWPLQARGQLEVEARIDAVERHYRREGLPVRLQITGAAVPADLDARLEARGYAVESPVAIAVAKVAAVAGLGPAPAHFEAEVLRAPDARWLAVSADGGRFAEARPHYEALLARIGQRARFALACREGQPLAVGLGVCDGDLFGVFSMLTLPEARRQGAGRTVLAALAKSARAAGATQLYLQVGRDNRAALSLYQAAGFRERYGYHYRRLDP
ncbi:MAG: GNAT family N-acetyltransferase [Myxococcales bacterium]|nr:GNAT family N-acetyltransferase [Myxococcales bacterium]